MTAGKRNPSTVRTFFMIFTYEQLSSVFNTHVGVYKAVGLSA